MRMRRCAGGRERTSGRSTRRSRRGWRGSRWRSSGESGRARSSPRSCRRSGSTPPSGRGVPPALPREERPVCGQGRHRPHALLRLTPPPAIRLRPTKRRLASWAKQLGASIIPTSFCHVLTHQPCDPPHVLPRGTFPAYFITVEVNFQYINKDHCIVIPWLLIQRLCPDRMFGLPCC